MQIPKLPDTFDILSISFVDSKHGFMVKCGPGAALGCQHNALWVTADGGSSWTLRAREVPTKIDFLSTKIGYGVSAPCACKDIHVWRTGDGGFTWQKRARIVLPGSGCDCGPVYDSLLQPLSMVSDSRGWLVSDRTAKIYSTSDGGFNWSQIPYSCPTGFRLDGASLVGEQSGFAICDGRKSNVLLRTDDSGNTFVVVNRHAGAAGTSYHLQFASPELGYLMPISGYPLAVMERTRDGGASFTSVYTSATLITSGLGFTGPKSSVMSLSPDISFPGDVSQGGLLMATSDSGAHWRQIYPVARPKLFGMPSFYSSTQGMAEFRSGWELSATTRTLAPAVGLYATDDGGASWSRVSDVPGQPYLMGSTHLITPDQGGFYFYDSATPGSVFRSDDAGKSWSELALPIRCGPPVFVSSSYGFLGAPGGKRCTGLYETTDGGATWSQTNPVKQVSILAAVPPSPGATGAVVWGANGLCCEDAPELFFSTDAGRTMQSVYIPPGMALESLSTTDREHIWVAGSLCENSSDVYCGNFKPAILRSTNGGQSWQVIKAPGFKTIAEQGYLKGFQFLSPLVGFFSDGKQLQITSDGGVNWKPVTMTVH